MHGTNHEVHRKVCVRGTSPTFVPEEKSVILSFCSATRCRSAGRRNRRRLQYSTVATWIDQRCLNSGYDQTRWAG